MAFKSLGINENIVNKLNKNGIKTPTPIQKESIPHILLGKDLIGEAKTGTGKTLAFLIPIFQNLSPKSNATQVLILSPTRELAIQITEEANKLNVNEEINILAAYGGKDIGSQLKKLKNNIHMIIATPGRLLDHIERKSVDLSKLKTIVIDEVDKLLDKNNLPTVKDIIKVTPKQTQIMMFSATLNGKTLDIAKTLAEDINVVSVKNNKVNENINHNYIKTDSRKKVETLRKLLNALKSPKVLVFNNDSYTTNTSVEYLSFNNVKVAAIGGNGKMEDRKRALENFRKGKINVLIASDIAARGLDIKGVTHVVNFDISEDSKDYLHRAGRVGRAGESGEVFSLVDDKEENIIKMHENSFKISITERILYRGTIE